MKLQIDFFEGMKELRKWGITLSFNDTINSGFLSDEKTQQLKRGLCFQAACSFLDLPSEWGEQLIDANEGLEYSQYSCDSDLVDRIVFEQVMGMASLLLDLITYEERTALELDEMNLGEG